VPQDIKKYKVVRRGPKWCVRVNGRLNTTDAFRYCHDRKMSYHIRQPWLTNQRDRLFGLITEYWDYDFIFDKEYEATAFILGYL
jgi:hypothetical protein